MGRMVDAVNPANIPAEYNGKMATTITVLADPTGQCFDIEAGNATGVSAAAAIAARVKAGKWAVAYVNESLFELVTYDLSTVGLDWADAVRWPLPGVYLWAADPSGNIAAGHWVPGFTPLAIQDTYSGLTDMSTTSVRFPAEVAGYLDGRVSAWPADAWSRFQVLSSVNPSPDPAPGSTPGAPPTPPITEVCAVNLPVLLQGSSGPSVRSVQTLVGGLTIDGIFGPMTKARVQAYQSAQRLAADGVVGVHTWGALLGSPQ